MGKYWLFVLIILLGYVAALDISGYLYPNETIDSVTQEKFIYNNEEYNIYFYDDEIWLIEANEILLSDESIIKNILTHYYSAEHFPDGIDLSSIEEKLDQFEESRNQDYIYSTVSFTGHEPERFCSHSLGFVNNQGQVDMDVCYDEETCRSVALRLAMRFDGKKISFEDVPWLGIIMLDYRTGITSINTNLESARNLTKTKSIDNLYPNLLTLKTNIQNIKASAQDIKESPARYPDQNRAPCLWDRDYIAENGKCLGLCSEIPYNLNILDSAITDINTLLTVAEPLSNIESISGKISSQADSRENYVQTKASMTSTVLAFIGLERTQNKSLEEAQEVMKVVDDPELKKLLSSINTLRTKIQNEIDTVTVSDTTTRDIDELGDKYIELRDLLASNLTYEYYEISSIKKRIVSRFVETKILMPPTEEYIIRYNELGERYVSLENSYKPPMSLANYKDYYGNYSELSKDLAILQNDIIVSQSGTVTETANSAKSSSIEGVFSLTAGLYTLDTTTKKIIEPLIPLILLAVTDISLIAVLALGFIALIYTNRPYLIRKRVVLTWGFTFLVGVLLIGMVSASSWYLMTRGTSPTDVGNVINTLKLSNEKAIVIDNRNSPTTTITSMRNCAQKLMTTKTFTNTKFYIIEPDSCNADGVITTPEKCEEELVKYPNIYMFYNRDELTKGYTFDKSASSMVLSGEDSVFDECEIFFIFNN